MIIKILRELGDTNSSNSKLEILKSYKDNTRILKLLRIACDPDYIINVKKLPELRTDGTYNFDETYDKFINLCDKLNTRKVTGNKALNEIKEFLDSCESTLQESYIKILKKDLRVNVSDTLLRKAYGDSFIKVLKIQLANNWKDVKKYSNDFWWGSPKLDGLRGYYEDTLKSRNGKDVPGFEEMKKEFESLKKEYSIKFGDGELFSDVLDFQTIQGFVRKNKNADPAEQEQIYYNIFVLGKDWKTTTEMVEFLESIDWSKYKYLRAVKYFKVPNNQKAIIEKTKEMMKLGYEGLMLRDPNDFYDNKRSDKLLKVKLFKEDDFFITDYEEGKGRLVGSLGKFKIENILKYKRKDIKIVSEVGSGFTDEQRIEFWKNREKMIGTLIEVKYQNITDKPNKEGNFSLRFPVFLKIKEDR